MIWQTDLKELIGAVEIVRREMFKTVELHYLREFLDREFIQRWSFIPLGLFRFRLGRSLCF